VVDQRVISPGGRLAVCTVAHVSTTFFDAEKFLFPSDDGATVFDFTSLPNGDVTTITPTNGRLTVRSATGSNLQILNGVLVASGANFYFEAGLPNLSLKLRHFWIIMDIIDNPPATSVIILHWLRFTQVGNGINSAAHCGFDANENGTGIGKWYSEPYPLNLGPAVGPVWKPNWSVGGDTVRLDMIFNPERNRFSDWYNGARVWEYIDPNFDAYVSAYAALQFGPPFKIKEWGISSKLPPFALAGPVRGVTGQSNVYTPLGDLTTTWQVVYQFDVFYDYSGRIEVLSTPWVICPAGRTVYMEVAAQGATGLAELNALFNPQIVASGASGRIPFICGRAGTPGTKESVAIWAKANSTGCSIERYFNGSSQNAYRYYSVQPML
jgi:hypothetical protein